MNLEDLLSENPRFLTTAQGEPVSYGLAADVLFYIADRVSNRSKTLETGAGISTVLFALLGTDHICITPNREEVDRITSYCNQRRVSLQKVSFLTERSEIALPRLEVNGLDLVLIDGRHAFPAPFIDWYYTVERLKIGGFMIVDDTQLWTGRVLKKFMLSEPEWQLDKNFGTRAVSFVKCQEGTHLKEWPFQSFVKRRSSLFILEHLICSSWKLLWEKCLKKFCQIL